MDKLGISDHRTLNFLFNSRKDIENIIGSASKISKDNVNTIRKHLDSLTEVITKLLVANEELKVENLNLKQNSVAPVISTPVSSSYAKVLQGKPPKPREEHVFIFSKLVFVSEELDSKDLMRNINPQAIKIGVRRTKETKSGDFVVEFNSADELNSLKKAVDCNENLHQNTETRFPKKADPKIIIFNVNKQVSVEDLVTSLQEQNNASDVIAKVKGQFEGKSGINCIELDRILTIRLVL